MTDPDSQPDASEESVHRRRFLQGLGASAAIATAGLSIETAAAQEGLQRRASPPLLRDLPDNWGRWGDDDELGALNLLGSDEAFDGMLAAMQRGRKRIERFTLQTPITGNAIDILLTENPGDQDPTKDPGDPAFPGRFPARKDNTADWRNADSFGGIRFADDRFDAPLYLQGTSHVDALGHGWFADRDVDGDGDVDRDDEQLYNGFDAETTASWHEFDNPNVSGMSADDSSVEQIDAVRRLSKADISNAADAGIQGRGVLLDVGRHLGDEETGRLGLDVPITLEDLLDTADAQGVEIRKRDILLIRTGAIERARDPDALWHPFLEPGLTYSDDLVHWIHEMEIPYVAGDNLPVEKVTHRVTADDLDDGREDLAGIYTLPLHGAFLRNLGLTLNEVLDLSDLAAACAKDGIYDFLFTAAPLNVEGGTGAPVNPVVTKATGDRDRGRGRGPDGDRGRGTGRGD